MRRLYDEVFNDGNLDVADELISPGFVSHGRAGRRGDRARLIKTSARILGDTFSGMHFDVQDVFATGDRVAVVIYRLDERGLAEQWARVGPVDATAPAAPRRPRR